MKYRCKYRTSDKIVVGASADVPSGHFDDGSHGTTIEFSGTTIPRSFEKIYNDTPPESLDPNSDYLASYALTTTETDTDSDGIIDIAGDDVATATINIQKKDKDDVDMVAAGDNDAVFIELSVGASSVASLSLVNGAGSFVLQSGPNVGCVVNIVVRGPDDRRGSITIKYR